MCRVLGGRSGRCLASTIKDLLCGSQLLSSTAETCPPASESQDKDKGLFVICV